MRPEREDERPPDLGDGWPGLSEERRRRDPAFAELEARIAAEGPSFVVARMTDQDGTILNEPEVMATSHPEDLAAVTAGDADDGRAVPSAYHAMGYEDADGMERKAGIVRAMAERIEVLGFTKAEAAARFGVNGGWLGRVLWGVFRGVAEADLVACLERLR